MRPNKMLQTAAASFAAIVWCATAGAASGQQPVENGLLSALSILGEPTRTMRLRDRMAHYGVPAVSVAVIEGNRTILSRAYGTVSRGKHEAATTDTLFQGGLAEQAAHGGYSSEAFPRRRA